MPCTSSSIIRAGHPWASSRPSTSLLRHKTNMFPHRTKTWMPATSAGMTSQWLRPPVLLDLAVGVVLRNEGPEIVDFLVVLDAGEGHLGARHLGLGIPDVFLELGLVPS